MVLHARTIGRYELVIEITQSQLGPLWVAHGSGEGAELVQFRRISVASLPSEHVDLLSSAAWWALDQQHPNLAQARDVILDNGELSISTDYVEGEVLRSLVRLSSFRRKPIPVAAAGQIALDILEALSALHADISDDGSGHMPGGLLPDSVLVGTDGITRLLDIGVAGIHATQDAIRKHAEIVAYASPEQIAGTTPDARSELFTVGVFLWEMLAGKRLFVGSTYDMVADRIKVAAVPRLDTTRPVGGEAAPKPVADFVARCVDPDPGARYGSARAAADALKAALGVDEASAREAVVAIVEQLAGPTLSTRRKAIQRAGGSIAPAKPAPAKPAAKQRQPTLVGIAPTKPKPAAESPAPPPVNAPQPPAKPPNKPPRRKATLMGMAPPKPRAEEPSETELERISIEPEPVSVEPMSLDPVSIEPVSADSLPVDSTELMSDPDSVIPVETGELDIPIGDSEPPAKNPFMVSEPVAKLFDEPASPPAKPAAKPAAPEAAKVVEAKPTEEPSLDPPKRVKLSSQHEGASPIAAIVPPAQDESAVLAALATNKHKTKPEDEDDEEGIEPPPPSQVELRTAKARKVVAGVVGGLAVLLIGGLAISKLGGDDSPTPPPSANTPAAAPEKSAKPEASDQPEPEAVPDAAVESSDASPQSADAAPDVAAEAAKEEVEEKPVAEATPRPVQRPTSYRPRPKPKPKPKFVPSGI